jgi:hypothetical protein
MGGKRILSKGDGNILSYECNQLRINGHVTRLPAVGRDTVTLFKGESRG